MHLETVQNAKVTNRQGFRNKKQKQITNKTDGKIHCRKTAITGK